MFTFRRRLFGAIAPLLILVWWRGATQLHGQGVPVMPEQTAESGVQPEQPGAFRLRIEWRNLFNQGSWTELETIADQLRSQRLRLEGGNWQLHSFYATISPAGPQTATDAAWEAQIAKLKEWEREKPESATPHVAEAEAYLKYAWKARGNGYSDTVTAEGWRLFGERVKEARAALERAPQTGRNDPEWYLAMQTVALAQSWDRNEVNGLVDAALNAEPGYFYFARAEANYLLPKWYGKSGETEKFAERVADRIGGSEGDATYFLIAATINCCRKTQAPAMSWERVRRGYSALEQLYGTNNYQRNAIAFLALRAGDTTTAHQAFARIGNDWDQSVWRSKARFDASRTGQAIANVKPVLADNDPRVDPED
jgi:Domain of unknown function (DUF4034)